MLIDTVRSALFKNHLLSRRFGDAISSITFQYAKIKNMIYEILIITLTGFVDMRTPLSKITSTGEIEQRFRLN